MSGLPFEAAEKQTSLNRRLGPILLQKSFEATVEA
jgi:hypothetical protein